MSTRSIIGLLHPDGKISTIYCHNDGYWSGVGLTLWEHWRNGKGIKRMIEHGSMSVLGEVIGEKHNFDWQRLLGRDFGVEFEALPDAEKNLYLDTLGAPNRYVYERAEIMKDPRSKMCLFYRRDRGESIEATRSYHGSIEDADWEEFAYLFDEANKRWITAETWGDSASFKWRLLSDVMAFYEQMPADEHGWKHLGHEGLPEDFPTIELPEPVLSPEDSLALSAQSAVAMF